MIYCWPLYQSLCSEILTKNEWLKLWDHIISDFPNNTLLDSFILAYNVYNRNTIMNLTKDEIENFFTKQNPIDINYIIKLMYEINNKYVKNNKFIPDICSFLPENTNILKYLPLRKGIYPIFDVYPQGIVNFELEERKRLALESSIINVKKEKLKELMDRASQLDREYKQLKSMENTLSIEDEKKLKDMGKELERKLAEAKKLDDEIMEKKLAAKLSEENYIKEEKIRKDKERKYEVLYYILQKQVLEKVMKQNEDMNSYYIQKKKDEESINSQILESNKRVY